jgi:hypothetical protein
VKRKGEKEKKTFQANFRDMHHQVSDHVVDTINSLNNNKLVLNPQPVPIVVVDDEQVMRDQVFTATFTHKMLSAQTRLLLLDFVNKTMRLRGWYLARHLQATDAE